MVRGLLLSSHTFQRALIQVFILGTLIYVAQFNYLLFHTLAELYGIVIACGIFIIAWTARQRYQNDYLLFVGVAYLFVAIFDTLHAFGFQGMMIFPDLPGHDLGPQLWIATRLIEACSLLAAPFFIRHRLHSGTMFFLYGSLSAFLLWCIFTRRSFPACFTLEAGLTPFKVTTEYLIIGLLIGAILVLRRYRHTLDRQTYRLLHTSLGFTILSEFCFALYLDQYDASNLAGHCAKIISHTLIYYAIIRTAIQKPFDLLFYDLKSRQEALLSAQEAARVGSWTLTPDNGRMLWTDEIYRLLELPNETPTSWTIFASALPQENRGELIQKMATLRRKGDAFSLEFSLTSHNGEQRHILLKAGKKEETKAGQQTIAGILKDITEMVAAERLREDVSRITHHDLRAPLGPIVSIPQMILDEGENLTDEQRDLIKVIHHSGLKVLAMLHNSLTLYKIEQGSYTIKADDFDLLLLLREVLHDQKELARQYGVTCELRLNGTPTEKGERLPCRGERLLLYTLFANLIGNAIEASPFGESVHIDALLCDGSPTISIRNRGDIPKEIRRRFFDKYVTAGKSRGTGLGTYSAMLVAKAHNGMIGIITGSGNTVLTITLPSADEIQQVSGF